MKNSTGNECTGKTAASSISVKLEPSKSLSDNEHLHFQTPTVAENASACGTKRPISLDLKNTSRKQSLVTPLIIASPDSQNMKPLTTTPDLEKILHLLPTPQPGLIYQAKATAVTSEQEAFGKGFEEALHSLRNNNKQSVIDNGSSNIGVSLASQSTTNVAIGTSGGSFSYANLETFNNVPIKDEPQNQSTSPPVSPIDMETQEKIKLERKRQRNRVAASKCRKRKLERISKLEEKVKVLKGENTELGAIVKNLKENVAQLKQQVIEHIESGCSINGNAILQIK